MIQALFFVDPKSGPISANQSVRRFLLLLQDATSAHLASLSELLPHLIGSDVITSPFVESVWQSAVALEASEASVGLWLRRDAGWRRVVSGGGDREGVSSLAKGEERELAEAIISEIMLLC